MDTAALEESPYFYLLSRKHTHTEKEYFPNYSNILSIFVFRNWYIQKKSIITVKKYVDL